MGKRKPSRTEIIIRNQSMSLTSVPRSSGSMGSPLARAKARSPFSVAHVPGQITSEHKGVVRVGKGGNKMINPSKGRFKG